MPFATFALQQDSKERGCREHGCVCASELWSLVARAHVVAIIALDKMCVLEIVADLESLQKS